MRISRGWCTCCGRGRAWVGSWYAGSAGRHSCVRAGTGCSLPAVRGGPVARGVRGRALSPFQLPSSLGAFGARCPRAVGTGVRIRGPALSPWPVFPVLLRGGQPGFRGPRVCCEGRLRSGAPRPGTVRPLSRLSGSVIHSCCGRGCAAVGARRCPLGLHALWEPASAGVVEAVPGGLARHRCEGRLVSGAVPPPVARPLSGPSGSATHMLWARVCGSGGPALFPRPACPVGAACCWAGGGTPLGGLAFHHCEGRLVSDAVPPPAARPLIAGVPRPVCPRCGWCGPGDPAQAPQLAPLRAGVARRGGGGKASREGCLPLLRGASEVRRSASPDCPPTGRAVGVHYPRAVGAGVSVWGPNAVPLVCMPCGGCVRRGWQRAVPGGGGLPPLRGASGVRRCPSSCRPSSGAGSRGPATRVSRVRSVRTCGPITGPTACALAGRRCSLWGWRKGVPGGDAFHRCEGRLRSGAPPPPTARPLGGLLGSATHVLWARACGCGGPTLSPWPARPVGAACRGVGGGPSPGGGGVPLL